MTNTKIQQQDGGKKSRVTEELHDSKKGSVHDGQASDTHENENNFASDLDDKQKKKGFKSYPQNKKESN